MTGFLWKHDGEVFLVTNWHNLTGVRPDTLKPNGSFFPNVLKLSFHVCKNRKDDGDWIAVRERNIPLFDKSDQPVWIEHSRQHKVDVAVVRLSDETFVDGQPYCINEINFERRWIPPVGAECFVVGYPEGLTGPFDTPIWKRASIASEPNHPVEYQPEILIDTLGNEGLSGSPVIAQASGVFAPKDNGKPGIGTWRNFLGIYAGRTSEDGVGFQLGRVWKAGLLNEIFQAGVPGHHPLMEQP